MFRVFCIVFVFFLYCTGMWGEENPTFKQRLTKAKNGDYIVAESNQMISVLSIHSLTADVVVLEEINAPLQIHPPSWPEWVKARAPGHSSWSMIEIDLHTGEIIECYSFSKSSWIQLIPNESLFATLLQLPLHPIKNDQRRRIGPPPGPGESDFRALWQPPLVFEGKTRAKAPFDAFEGVWPSDGTEWEGKILTLYFDRDLSFPFPYWIQIDTPHAVTHFRAIDSGRNLPSPHPSMPHKTPQFVGPPKKTEKGVAFSVKTPKYFHSFELFAIDVTDTPKQIIPVPYSLLEEASDFLTLEVAAEALQEKHRYTWLLIPQKHRESYAEMNHPITWPLSVLNNQQKDSLYDPSAHEKTTITPSL